MLEPQTGEPFSNASVQGTYAGGSSASLDNANTADEVYTLSGAGGGTITANSASSEPGGLGLDLGGTIKYAIGSNRRGTAEEGQGGKNQGVLYIISPTKFVVLLPQTAAEMLVFEH